MIGKRALGLGLTALASIGCAGCTALQSMSLGDQPPPAYAASDGNLPVASASPPSAPSPSVVTPGALVPIGGGNYSDPATGTVYTPAGQGAVISTQTGQVVPVPQ